MPAPGPDDCPFCRAAHEADPGLEIHRDHSTVALTPTNPATPGHVLVIPHRHAPDVWSLDDDEAAALARSCLRLAHAIRRALSPQGLTIIQSNGTAAGQTVPHLHIHLVPRNLGDALGSIWPTTPTHSPQQHETARRRIRAALNAPDPGVSPEDRRKHLDHIQAIIARQAAASTAAKGWLLPVVTAAFGFALIQHSWAFAAVAAAAIILFGYLDHHYLDTERRYRDLYDTVAQGTRPVPPFTLDPSHAEPRHHQPTLRSWSILPFYGALLLLDAVVLALSLCGWGAAH